MTNEIINRTDVTCPFCGFRETLEIPTDQCLFFHRCANCNMQIRPLAGDCCIFCSYGNDVCLPKQAESWQTADV